MGKPMMKATPPMPDRSAILARKRYQAVRQIVYDTVAPAIVAAYGTEAQLTMIGPAALEVSREIWPAAHGARGHSDQFRWDEIAHELRNRYDRFEVALWSGEQLCALCAGLPSKGPKYLTIRFMESFEGDHPFKGLVAPIMFDVANAYAVALERQILRLEEPVPTSVPICEDNGFALASEASPLTYYERKVTR